MRNLTLDEPIELKFIKFYIEKNNVLFVWNKKNAHSTDSSKRINH